MITKLFEVRDRMTFIPVMAAAMSSERTEDAYLLGRAGYRNYEGPTAVIVTRLIDCESANGSHEWSSNARTMQISHQFIEVNFYDLESGAVIDVEFILGETDKPKTSERLEGLRYV